MACTTDRAQRGARRRPALRIWIVAAFALMAPVRVAAEGARARTDLFIEVPLDGASPGVVFPFGGSHHQVPGVVTIDRAPYVCEVHRRAFHDRAAFVAHLRRRHALTDADIPRAVLVEGGQVRYVGK